MEGLRTITHCRNCSNSKRIQPTAGTLNRAVEIRDVAELDVEVEGRGWLRQRPRRGDRGRVGGVGVGPRGAAADEARADEDDEGGAHPEADHRGHQIQPGPQHLRRPSPSAAAAAAAAKAALPSPAASQAASQLPSPRCARESAGSTQRERIKQRAAAAAAGAAYKNGAAGGWVRAAGGWWPSARGLGFGICVGRWQGMMRRGASGGSWQNPGVGGGRGREVLGETQVSPSYRLLSCA